jgi:DNA polymerase-1
MSRYVVDYKGLIEPEHFQSCSLKEAIDYLSNLDEIQVDSETEGFDPYTKNPICYQLGDKTGENQFLFPYSKENMSALKPILENNNKTFIFQNSQFDLRFLRRDNIIVTNIFDVFLAECLLTTSVPEKERQLGLDYLVFKYTGNTLNKSVRGVIHRENLSSRVIVYACEDVKYMSQVKAKQIEKLKELDLMNVMDLENKAAIAFSAMCYNGIKLNQSKWKEVSINVEKDLKKQIEILDNIVIKEKKLIKYCSRFTQSKLFDGFNERVVKINWASDLQKKKVLISLFGDSIEDSSDRTLQKYKKKHKLVGELIKFNKLSKLQSSFGNEFLKHINPVTNRIHPEVWQILSTGRISVSNPNLNQIPAKGEIGNIIRSCFIPEEGNVIVGGDYSGMELRIIAEFSDDPVWVNAFIEGKDLHSLLCSMTFGIPETDVKKPFPLKPEMTYRDVQKTINFGLAYGMSEFKLADTIDISTKDAKSIIDKFFSQVPKVKKLLDTFGNLAKTYGRIRTAPPFRRIREFENWQLAVETQDFKRLGEIERAGKNSPIQGTNSDIIKLAMHLLQTEIDRDKLPIKIILSVYDEIRCEAHKSIAEYWKDRMNTVMLESAKTVIKKVPIVVDCKITDCWIK